MQFWRWDPDSTFPMFVETVTTLTTRSCSDELYLYVCAMGEKWMIREWIDAAADVLRRHPGWGLVIGIPFGRLYLFEDRLIVPSSVFARCRDVDSVVKKINACGPFTGDGGTSRWIRLHAVYDWEEWIRKHLATLGITDVTYHHRNATALVVTCQDVLITVVERPQGIAVEWTSRANYLSQHSLDYAEYCEIASHRRGNRGHCRAISS